MLDHRLFLDDGADVLDKLRARGVADGELQKLGQLVDARRGYIQTTEALRRELNEASQAVQKEARAGNQEAVERARVELKSLKERIKDAEEKQSDNAASLEELLLQIPNVPHATSTLR